MSTILYTSDDFIGFAAAYATLGISAGPYAPLPHLVNESLFAAYLANRAAYVASYPHQAGVIEPPINLYPGFEAAAPAAAHGPEAGRQWVRDVRLLLYNCMDNTGASYLPHEHTDRLVSAAQGILDTIAGI